jgi:serine/threonine protein kinase
MAIGTVGKYERLEVLGHGASGIVYLAWDTLLRRNIALKEIRAAGPEIERVLSEARVLDRLRHPNIIEVHSVDQADGVILLDMELVRGQNLSDVLRVRNGEPLPIADAIRIASAVLEALAYAHERRILHKDVKPANILIASDNKTVKLTDFGLAEALGSGSVAGGGGTYPYMAPEDFAERDDSDYRSDLWAVGVVLYEMLTNKRPFAVQRSKDPFAWKRVIETEVPTAPSAHNPEVSEELDAIVLKALTKDKNQRYPNARVFADALAALKISVSAAASVKIVEVASSDSSVFTFADGTEASDLDEFLLGAARNWDASRKALGSGEFEAFLRRIGEVYIADLASELSQKTELGPDRRLREFLERARGDEPEAKMLGGDEEKTVPFALPKNITLPRLSVPIGSIVAGGQAQAQRPEENPEKTPVTVLLTDNFASKESFRWWFPFVWLLCFAPATIGVIHARDIANARLGAIGLAATGILSAMLMLVGIGVKMPFWTRFFCLLPVILGVMAAGILAAQLIDGQPTPERLLTVGIAALFPLGVLLLQAATARRLWRLWLVITLLGIAGAIVFVVTR